MRELTTKKSVLRFLERLGNLAAEPTQVYITGGACAILYEWRDTTVDIDMKIHPESSDLLKQLPKLKEELNTNVELVAPSDFIPELPGWRDRSVFIGQFGKVSAYHYDPCSQALSKLERGHERDLKDAQAMVTRGLLKAGGLLGYLEMIEPELYRYPAIDPKSFRKAVLNFVNQQK